MLVADNIHKVYRNGAKEFAVLKGITVKIEEGAFVALVGPSGAGKSTFLHIIGGLDSPTQGSVSFFDRDLYHLKDEELCMIRNKEIGFVFQFYHLLSEFTVLENVLMPVLIGQQGLSGCAQAKDNALRLLKRVGLAERVNHFPNQLSGGEQQRVAIVRALVNSPRLLLCDEPTGNLDSKTSEEIIALIRTIHKENRMTTLLVTHNAELAHSAERMYHLKDGLMVR